MNGKQYPLYNRLEAVEYDTPSVQAEQTAIESLESLEPEQEVWQFEPSICG